MSSTTLPVCPKTGSTSPSLTVHLCLHTAPGNRECALDDCPAWTDHPIVTGVTPLRAEHINEIRACIDFLLQRDPLPVQPPCEDAWTHSGTGPAIIDVPACLDQVRLRVSPSTSTVSRFWFWKRDTL